MDRFVSSFLDQWLMSEGRKPLVLRGARQVGKTWLVRDLAKRQARQLIELNFERRPELAEHFTSNDPRRVIRDLSTVLGITVRPEEAILFLDEVQATPQLLAYLRWFQEEMNELPVVAAGSLIDFAMREHDFSMPVGRIGYCYVEPASFYEFLDATGNERLHRSLEDAAETLELGAPLHCRALDLFSEYCVTGGMPEVVTDWVEHRDEERMARLKHDLLDSLREDFNKYRNRVPAAALRQALDAVPRQLGTRFVYEHVDSDESVRYVKQAVDLLVLARACHRIEHTAANGLPLGAEANRRLFKMVLLDIGLGATQLGLSQLDLRAPDDVIWANKGAMAEQFVAQHLRHLSRPWEDPRLFYWQRTGGRPGEIDYVIQHHDRIVPVEVKSGSSGSMKSLHSFMQTKGYDLAVRLDTNPPSVQELDLNTTTGDPVRYRLLSFPLYMTESLRTGIDRYRPSRLDQEVQF